jgi:mono/diheme cytochrome c family protein
MTMLKDDDEDAAVIFTATCLGCHQVLRLAGGSEDELRELLAETRWQMVADAPMADPIADHPRFLCPDCPVTYL